VVTKTAARVGIALVVGAALACAGDAGPATDADVGAGTDATLATGDTGEAGTSGSGDTADADSTASSSTASSTTASTGEPESTTDATEGGSSDDGGPMGQCDASPGASADAEVLGPTSYTDPGTTMVVNVIFEGEHADDLVRVNNGHVVFDHVTFRGTGTGATGHTLEVKVGGSAEVYDSIFEGAPTEDTVQTEGNAPTLVSCSVFATTPGEDHVDTKPGEAVTIEYNDFAAPATGRTIQNHNGSGEVHLVGNTGMQNIFYEDGATGSMVGNEIPGELWLYDATNVLVEDNVIGLVKHGEGSSDRDPTDTYFLDNTIDDAADNGGTCFADGNDGAAAVSFCTPGPPDWYEP
jgi:hypothetical protein